MVILQSLYLTPVMEFGTEEQKENWVRPFCDGKRLSCFMLSEPGINGANINLLLNHVREYLGFISYCEHNCLLPAHFPQYYHLSNIMKILQLALAFYFNYLLFDSLSCLISRMYLQGAILESS